ncbi:Ribokinase [Mycena kentingensis (nom. inval.)]|nr:Ribokinase [Mycena kentingensis (nom. inval.)]
MPPRCLVRGSINIDEFFKVKDFVLPGQTISSSNLVKRLGGKGANQSVAIARAGGIVDFVGAVGQDGLWVRDDLERAGVNVDGILVVEESTGRAIIQVNKGGENILFKGANYASVPPQLQPFHPDTTHVVFQNEVPLDSTIAFLTLAAEKHISTVFNPSPMPTPDELKFFPWDKLTWLVVNAGEAADLCSHLGLRVAPSDLDSSPKTASLLIALASHMPRTNIVCTLGADGVLAKLLVEPDPVHLPAATLDGPPLDTTGAGDCFTGYMVAGLMALAGKMTSDYLQVLRRATQAAGMCVEKAGGGGEHTAWGGRGCAVEKIITSTLHLRKFLTSYHPLGIGPASSSSLPPPPSPMDFIKEQLNKHGKEGEQGHAATTTHGEQHTSTSTGGGGFMDKINGALGGGAKGEEKEDGLDKAVDFVQEHILHQGQQSNETAMEQATDEQISDAIRRGYKDVTGHEFFVKDKE